MFHSDPMPDTLQKRKTNKGHNLVWGCLTCAGGLSCHMQQLGVDSGYVAPWVSQRSQLSPWEDQYNLLHHLLQPAVLHELSQAHCWRVLWSFPLPTLSSGWLNVTSGPNFSGPIDTKKTNEKHVVFWANIPKRHWQLAVGWIGLHHLRWIGLWEVKVS